MPYPILVPDASDPNLRRALDGEMSPRTRNMLHCYLGAEEPPALISRDQFAAALALVLADPKRVEDLSNPYPFRGISDLTTEERMRHLLLLLELLYEPA